MEPRIVVVVTAGGIVKMNMRYQFEQEGQQKMSEKIPIGWVLTLGYSDQTLVRLVYFGREPSWHSSTINTILFY